jgi:hypothetical protein
MNNLASANDAKEPVAELHEQSFEGCFADMKKKLLGASAFVLFIVVSSGMGKVVHADANVAAGEPRTSQIDYHFVGHLEKFDNYGRLLVWEAKIRGSFSGTMKWWFVNPSPVPAADYDGVKLSYYSARWEVWLDSELLLAGNSTGKTVFQNGANGVWDGHGVVTEARPEFITLVGNRIYETGPVVIGSNPPVSYAGSGLFVVY